MKKLILLLSLTASVSAFAGTLVKPSTNTSTHAISRVTKVFDLPVQIDGGSSSIHLVTYSRDALNDQNDQRLVITMSDISGASFNVFNVDIDMATVNSIVIEGTDLVVSGRAIDLNTAEEVDMTKRIQILEKANTLDFLDAVVLK